MLIRDIPDVPEWLLMWFAGAQYASNNEATVEDIDSTTFNKACEFFKQRAQVRTALAAIQMYRRSVCSQDGDFSSMRIKDKHGNVMYIPIADPGYKCYYD